MALSDGLYCLKVLVFPGLNEVVDDLALAQLAWQAGGKLDVYWTRSASGSSGIQVWAI